jgi:hypothetical protein
MSWHFTESEKEYMRTHYQTETMYQMAKHLNRQKSSVAYHLVKILKLKVPDQVHAQNKASRKAAAIEKQNKNSKVKIQKSKPIQAPVQKQIKRRVDKKPLPTPKLRIANFTSLIPLRINHKTTLYVKPGADIQRILKQYQRQHAN